MLLHLDVQSFLWPFPGIIQLLLVFGVRSLCYSLFLLSQSAVIAGILSLDTFTNNLLRINVTSIHYK
jgi:hypothetical protein